MKKLNGWQRLWVVASILFGIWYFFTALDTVPSKTQVMLEWEFKGRHTLETILSDGFYCDAELVEDSHANLDAGDKRSQESDRVTVEQGPWLEYQGVCERRSPAKVLLKWMSDHPNGVDVIEQFNAIEERPTAFQQPLRGSFVEINNDYRAMLEALPKKQAQYWLLTFAIWLALCLFVYALGWTVAWVLAGFKRDRG